MAAGGWTWNLVFCTESYVGVRDRGGAKSGPAWHMWGRLLWSTENIDIVTGTVGRYLPKYLSTSYS